MGTQDHRLLPAPATGLILPGLGAAQPVEPPPGQPVIYKPSLFRDEGRELVYVPEGLTVAETLALVVPDRSVHAFANISVGGHQLLREHWHRIRTKPGQQLAIILVPAGGQDILRTVLILAVVVALAFAAPYLLPVLGPGMTAAVIAGVSTAAFLAINALIPPAVPELDGSTDVGSNTYRSLSGARNSALISTRRPSARG